MSWDYNESSDWKIFDLSGDNTLDLEHCITEFENIQVIHENDLFLIVAYYKLKIDEKLNRYVEQICNWVFEINWYTNTRLS